jgi:hypothetical protein
MAQITNIQDLKISTYKCGSQRLSHAIKTKLNLMPVNIYEDPYTKKIINVFIMNPILSAFLIKWSEESPKNKAKKEIPKGEKL